MNSVESSFQLTDSAHYAQNFKKENKSISLLDEAIFFAENYQQNCSEANPYSNHTERTEEA
jgi:hypothetical protein